MALKGPRDLSSDELRERIKGFAADNEYDEHVITGYALEIKRRAKLISMRRAASEACEAELKRRDGQ